MRRTLFLWVLVGLLASFTADSKKISKECVGVYWGAFDPPTEAHLAIIIKAANDIPLKKLIVVVNNHSYKNYAYSLEERLHMMKASLQQKGLDQVELLWQDASHQIDFLTLKAMVQEPLCAIAGYDAYKTWSASSASQDRSRYEAIAVVPRGDEEPILFDQSAFLLPIDPRYKDVSSTKVRDSLCRKMVDSACNESEARNISAK